MRVLNRGAAPGNGVGHDLDVARVWVQASPVGVDAREEVGAGGEHHRCSDVRPSLRRYSEPTGVREAVAERVVLELLGQEDKEGMIRRRLQVVDS
jgi:hypothetical protein